MAGLTPLPQTVQHSSTRLTHLEAHTLLSSFLTAADTNPAYRPDAVLTQHGPQAVGIGSGTNLTLNHLNRILLGIAGTRVGGVDFNYGEGPPRKRARRTAENEHAGYLTSTTSAKRQKASDMDTEDVVEVDAVGDAQGQGEAALVGHETDGWQDKEDYEHAQIDDVEDVGDRDPADPGSRIEGRVDDMEVSSIAGQKLTKAEKEARKLAKKERRKKEKHQRSEQRAKPKEEGEQED